MAQRAPILNMPKGPLQLICDATAIKEELYFLDMRINDKKSVCIRFGIRHDLCCAPVTTCIVAERYDGCRYLGIYFVSARSFKCTFEPARSKFYKSFNAIFGKIGRVASESVIMQLISYRSEPVNCVCTPSF